MNLQQPKEMNFGDNLSHDWEKFKKAFEIYRDAMEIDKKGEPTQIGILLHCIGEKGREVYETLTFSEVEQNKYIPVIKKFGEEFSPKKNTTYERFKFNSSNQKLGQTIEGYISELKKLSSTCEFGVLNESLIVDRLICGVRDNALRERMLRQVSLNLDAAIVMAKSAELVASQVRDLTSTSKDTEIEHVDEISVNQIIKKCKFCGGSHKYGKSHCPSAENKCRKCGRIGHFEKLCYTGKYKKRQESNDQKFYKKKQVNNFECRNDGAVSSDSDDFFIGQVLNTENFSTKDWTEAIQILDFFNFFIKSFSNLNKFTAMKMI